MERQQFSLFQSHLDLAHQYWERLLKPGDWAIDATCGNGHDTLKLAQILKGSVIGIDIQEEAISRTKALLETHLTSDISSQVHLYHQSHVTFPDLALKNPIRLIVYNLGYLPRGNKQLTTLAASTLESLSNAMELIPLGGAISLVAYPGHEEGAREYHEILNKLYTLDSRLWNVCQHISLNRERAPSLFIIQKNISCNKKYFKYFNLLLSSLKLITN